MENKNQRSPNSRRKSSKTLPDKLTKSSPPKKNHNKEIDLLNSESSDRRSLFDEYILNESPDFWVKIKPDLSNMPIIKQEQLLIDGKYYRISNIDGELKVNQMYLEGYDKYLLAFKEKNEKPVAYLNVLFAQVKTIQYNHESFNLPYYG